MKNNFKNLSLRQLGFTLVELMVALTIGLFLLGAVSALFVNTRKGFDYSNELGRIQETGRFALEAIARDVRMAGYNGCGNNIVETANVVNGALVLKDALGNPLPGTGNQLLDFSTAVRGYEGGVDTLPTLLTVAGALAGTDALILIGASNGDIVVKSHNPNAAQIDTNVHSMQKGEILLITDCSKASIFQMTTPTNVNNNATNLFHDEDTNTPGNCTKFLGASCPGSTAYTFKPGSMILRLSSSAYFIGNSSLNNGTRSLYVVELEGSTTGVSATRELLVGVDNMQITYGIDSDSNGSVDSFTTADLVTKWSQVTSIKVSLLVRSTLTNLATSAQPYVYASVAGSSTESTITPSDRILRKVFTQTMVVRNRTF